jgi:hypothetical protein
LRNIKASTANVDILHGPKENPVPATRPIEFDVFTLYDRAATAVVRIALAQSHGEAFADEFVADHRYAIQRAVRGRLSGRMDCVVRVELQALRCINQSLPSHD